MEAEEMCPRYQRAATLLGKKWTGLLIRILMGGPRHFTDFRAQVPALSDRMLSERLKELEDAAIVERIVSSCRPVSVTYRLTEKGEALKGVVEAIQGWADAWERDPRPGGPPGESGAP